MPTHRENLATALKTARLSAGFRSQAALAEELHVDRSNIGKAESPGQPTPSPELTAAIAKATGADPDELAELLKRSKSGTPDWFGPYLEVEQSASMLRMWAPVWVPGPMQTESYARTLLSASPHTPERLNELVDARMARQGILNRAHVVAVIRACVLQECLGSPGVMAEQCARLASLAARPNVALYVVPEGTNTGAGAGLSIASRGATATVILSTALDDIPTTSPDQIDRSVQTFERLLATALSAAPSLDFLLTWEETWKERI